MELEAEAKRYRARAKQLLDWAEDFEQRARILGMKRAASEEPSSAPVRDWRGVRRATALHEYMRAYPAGVRVQISEVVKALVAGGCDVAGKQRPGETSSEKEAERNLFISAAQSRGALNYDRKTREIWRT